MTDAERLREIARELGKWRDIEGSGYSSLVAMSVAIGSIADRLEKWQAFTKAAEERQEAEAALDAHQDNGNLTLSEWNKKNYELMDKYQAASDRCHDAYFAARELDAYAAALERAMEGEK